jgi:hypothetical protein
VAVLLASVKKADESIAAPKGHGPRTPAGFSLQTSRFKGPPEGAMIATMDPRQADAVMVGEGHAPLWQYLLRS